MQLEPEEKTKSRSDIKQSSGKKPASGWRTLWEAVERAEYDDDVTREAGDQYWSLDISPTKAEAEADVAEYMLDHIRDGYLADKYLGAFSLDGE